MALIKEKPEHHHCATLKAVIVTKWRSKQPEMMAHMNKTSLVFYESCQEVLLVLLALTAGSFKRGALRGYYFETSQ